MKIQKTGLILSGGGARAAYQVGVLKAIHHILPPGHYHPFDVISGTSAGAVNGIALACYAENYRKGIKHLERIWRHFSCDQVYKTDLATLSGSALRLTRSVLFGRRQDDLAPTLLNNSPLRELLEEVIEFDQIQKAIDHRALHAVAVNCSGLDSGESVSFFQGQPEVQEWQRQRRIGVRQEITLDHLMASSAIPMIFPAVFLGNQFYADGAVRQLAPISPAIHMGAEKVLVIGVSSIGRRTVSDIPDTRYPSPGKMIGHMLNAAFLDSMESDVERLKRINNTLRHIPRAVREHSELELRPIELLEISPSQSLDIVAEEHAHELPRALKMALGNPGKGSGVTSYLLFSEGYCRALIQLGYDDAMAQASSVREFFRDHFDDSQLS